MLSIALLVLIVLFGGFLDWDVLTGKTSKTLAELTHVEEPGPLTEAIFLQDFAVTMIAAGVAALLFTWLKQPLVVGYILIGAVIGPHTPPINLIQNTTSIMIFSQWGVIFLMFALGMDFNLRKIRAVGAKGLLNASIDVPIMILLGYGIGRLLGWGNIESVFLGVIICDSSTTLLAKAFNDLGWSRKRFVPFVFGTTIIEDMYSIGLIVLLSGLATTGAVAAGPMINQMTLMLVFLVSVLVFGLLLVPRWFDRLMRNYSDEVIVLTMLGLIFGVSLIAMKLNFSLALGAFLIGVIAAELRQNAKIERLTSPLKHMFSAVFFVSLGLMIQPALLIQYWMPVLLLSLVVIVGKTVNIFIASLLGGQKPGEALYMGVSLAQIGEFAYIVAAMGVTMGATAEYLYQVAICVSVLTTLVNPFLLRQTPHVVNYFQRFNSSRLAHRFRAYQAWLSSASERKMPGVISTTRRRSFRVIGMNLLLSTGIFLIATLLEQKDILGFLGDVFWHRHSQYLFWGIAMLITLPMFAMSFRKWMELSCSFVGVILPSTLTAAWVPKVRHTLAHLLMGVGALCLALFLFGLSAGMISPAKYLLIMIPAAAIILKIHWARLNQIYSAAELSLFELFERRQPTRPPAEMQDAFFVHTEVFDVPANSRIVNQTLAGSQLRTQTGVNLLTIMRDGATIMNPRPDEVIREGDQLVLLGKNKQIHQAIEWMLEAPAGE